MDYIKISEKIRLERLKKGFSRQYLAEQTGLSRPTITTLEVDSSKVLLRNLVNVCNFLNIPINLEIDN